MVEWRGRSAALDDAFVVADWARPAAGEPDEVLATIEVIAAP